MTQSRSFCERAEIFTGLSPRDSGFFTAIGYDPRFSPFKKIRIPFAYNRIERILLSFNIYRRIRNKIIGLLRSSDFQTMKAYAIPTSFLRFFALTEDKGSTYSEKAFDGLNNIFSDCKNNDIKVYQDSFTSLSKKGTDTDLDRIGMINKNIHKDFNLYLLYIGVIDKIGHVFGPNSSERRKKLFELDQVIEQFYSSIINDYPDTNFIFLGDHGMARVSKVIDVRKEILKISKKLKTKEGKDYIYFLDSTMFRVWFSNSKTREKFEKSILDSSLFCNNGIFVDKNSAKDLEIPFPDHRYGDILWLANTGVLVFPDFFHTSEAYKGMHGYDVLHKESKGVCLESSKKHEVWENIMLTDIYHILKKKLNLS